MKSRPLVNWKRFLTHGGLIFLGLSAYCIISSWTVLTAAAGQDTWPETRGIVTLSRVDVPIGGTSQKSTRYLFSYKYWVMGKEYQSDRYSFASIGGERSTAVKRYKEGDQVRVFYNPQDPSYAVLVKESPGLFVYLFLILGVGFLLAAISTLTYWFVDPAPRIRKPHAN